MLLSALSTNVGDEWRLRKLRCNFLFLCLHAKRQRDEKLLPCHTGRRRRLQLCSMFCAIKTTHRDYHKDINPSIGILILSLNARGILLQPVPLDSFLSLRLSSPVRRCDRKGIKEPEKRTRKKRLADDEMMVIKIIHGMLKLFIIGEEKRVNK